MKKLLVLSLLVVFALGSTAFASPVSISGQFGAELATGDVPELRLLEGQFNYTSSLDLELEVNAEGSAWSFEAEIGDLLGTVALGKYGLNVKDDNFVLDVWGNNYRLSHKNDVMSFVRANRDADPGIRVAITAIEEVSLTIDARPSDLYGFADFTVNGYDLGVAAQRELTATDARTTMVGYGSFDVDIAAIDVAAGMTTGAGLIAADNTFALGGEVTLPVADEVEVYASYITVGEAFYGNKSDANEFKAGLEYNADAFNAGFDFANTNNFAGTDEETIVTIWTDFVVEGFDFDVALANNLTANTNDLSVDIEGTVVEGFVDTELGLGYGFGSGQTNVFTADLGLDVYVSDNFTVMPSIAFEKATGVDAEFAAELGAEYVISDVTLAGEVGLNKNDTKYAGMSVSVGF